MTSPRPVPTWTPQEPREAIHFFEQKGYRVAFDSIDVTAQEHARAFTVAKMTSLDLLSDVHEVLDDAIKTGMSPAEFRKILAPKLKAAGWWGRQRVVDPNTGEVREVQLGSKERLETIFDTNVRSAYAAERWEQIQRTKRALPFLRYVESIATRKRPEHLRFVNLVLPVDDAFWVTHYPPNGYRCTCSVQQVTAAQVERLGLRVGNAPPFTTKAHVHPRTGEVRYVPLGIDPGFEVNVGIAHDGAARVFGIKVASVPIPRLGAMSWDIAYRDLQAPLTRGLRSWTSGLKAEAAQGTQYPIGALTEDLVKALEARGAGPASAGIMLEDRAALRLMADRADAADAIATLPQGMRAPIAVTRDGADLIYRVRAPKPDEVMELRVRTVPMRAELADKGIIANVVQGVQILPESAAMAGETLYRAEQ